MSTPKHQFSGSATQTAKSQPSSSQSNPVEWKALSDTFHDAAGVGDLEKVEAMLQDNPNLVFSRIVHFGDTPLHAAARNGHKGIAELLMASGADVNIRDQNDHSPLHDTVGHGHKEVVELLLANGADVNAQMYGGYTPLQIASTRNLLDMVELLRRHGGR